MKDLITAVRDHALSHYNEDGWDFLVECWEDADIQRTIKSCTTEASAIEACRVALKPISEKRDEVYEVSGEYERDEHNQWRQKR